MVQKKCREQKTAVEYEQIKKKEKEKRRERRRDRKGNVHCGRECNGAKERWKGEIAMFYQERRKSQKMKELQEKQRDKDRPVRSRKRPN